MASASKVSGRFDAFGAPQFHLKRRPTLDKEWRAQLQKMWNENKYTDVTLIAAGRKFHANKMILEAHSKYFREMKDFNRKSKITLKDIAPEMLDLVLKYIYIGEVELGEFQIKRLLEAAEALGVASLEKQCKYALLKCKPLTPENSLEIWGAASELGDDELGGMAKAIALKYFPILQHGPAFKQMPYGFALEYLTHRDLNVQHADERLHACLNWVRTDESSRVSCLSKFFDHLPLKDMDRSFLQMIMTDPLIERHKGLQRKLDRL